MARHEKGFTVTELMVTIVVVGIVVASISALFMTIQRTQVRTANLESATRAALRQIEVLRNQQYNQLEPGSTIDFTGDLPGTLREPRSGVVTVSEPTSGLRQVDVAITYRDEGGDRTVEFSSLIGVLGITQ